MDIEKRIIREAIFGLACYELDESQTTNEMAVYIHKGIVGTKGDAKRWLKGKPPLKFIRVYPVTQG